MAAVRESNVSGGQHGMRNPPRWGRKGTEPKFWEDSRIQPLCTNVGTGTGTWSEGGRSSIPPGRTESEVRRLHTQWVRGSAFHTFAAPI